tara:strand:- start:955 stop:2016 length:1062 start_codon:yes stop_codon:yes gene_type:complete
MKKIIHVLGARPNFIKAAPLIKKIKMLSKIESIILHTGQHYDKNMSEQFFDDLNIPKPDINLGLGGGSHAVQTAEMMKGCEEVFNNHKPNLVIVYGDVNSCVAATLVASKLHIKVVHIESGLRSGDKTMPEEINRIVTDSLSDYLFVTCEDAVFNLKDVHGEIFFVGNTMIDSLVEFKDKFHDKFSHKSKYGLITIHRPFTVDNKLRLRKLMDALVKVSKKHNIELIFPLHPRTRNALVNFNLYKNYVDDISFINPQGYIDFMSFQKHAKFIITDSGGVQEESSFFNVPCLTVRDNTERPITCIDGTNKLIGTNYENILDEVNNINYNRKSNIKLWDGMASKRIVKIIKDKIT